MNLLSLTDVTCTLSDTPLFREVTMGIKSGERIGFIGPNGSGKSTFLSLLRGSRSPDTGVCYTRSDLTIAWLPQIPDAADGATVGDLVFRSNNPKAALVREYESFIENYDGTKQQDLEEIQARMEREDAWNIENTYHSFLTELGIHDLSRPARTLSGGELRKVDMARVLASGADLLLLDEPTNHLDLETVEWLECWLRSGRRTYVLVTHDRSFLDNSCDIILELDEGRIRKYPGNWSTYLGARAKRLEEEHKNAGKRAALLRRELEWASRQPRARAGKDKKRLNRIENLQEESQADRQRLAEFSAGGRRLGKKVLDMVGVEKSRAGRRVIAPFSYSFRRGERIGIAGPNGAGKTTLLSLASGRLEPDAGRMDVGVNTRFAVLDQSSLEADEDLIVVDYMREEAQIVRRPDGSPVDVMFWLERFGFPPSARRRKIRYLSGGERRRLQFVRMLMTEPNFLILDEPTNDLDLITLELMERFLETYEGCLMVVSHDRTFLERVVDYFFVLDGTGSVRGFAGTWSEYRETVGRTEKPVRKSVTRKNQRTPKSALNYREKKEMEELAAEIEILENELTALEAEFSRTAPDPAILAEAGRRHAPLMGEIARKTERWEALASRDSP